MTGSSGPVLETDRHAAARVFREEARREGFTRVGIALAGEPPGYDRFRQWLAAGYHAGMNYLDASREVRRAPDRILPGARSIVCLSSLYDARPLRARDGSEIARYARGPDYHGAVRQRAERVARGAIARLPAGFRYRVCVDSTPLSERAFAAAAGLGWIGKNGCLIDPTHGSYLLLAEILTDLDLPPDDPVAEQCGSCVRCLEACPTGALLPAGVLDANRCLAYWTIEHRGPIPDGMKEALGHHVFGCDVCQEVCPWNAPSRALRRADAGAEPCATAQGKGDAEPDPPPTRPEWLAMGPGRWRRRFGATALNRAGRRGIQRNVAASAGSVADRALLPALQRSAGAREAGLSDAASWAAERITRRG